MREDAKTMTVKQVVKHHTPENIVNYGIILEESLQQKFVDESRRLSEEKLFKKYDYKIIKDYKLMDINKLNSLYDHYMKAVHKNKK